jgi:hypothetical protein
MSYTAKFAFKLSIFSLVVFVVQSISPANMAYAEYTGPLPPCPPGEVNLYHSVAQCVANNTATDDECDNRCSGGSLGEMFYFAGLDPNCPGSSSTCETVCKAGHGKLTGYCHENEESEWTCVCSDSAGPSGTCEFKGAAYAAYSVCMYESIKKDVANALDIRRTVMDMTATLATDVPMYASTGKGIDQATACMLKTGGQTSGVITSNMLEIMSALSAADCATFNSNPLAVAAGVQDPPKYANYSGSLAGIVMKGTTLAYTEPVPVSMAYYSRHLASKIPFVKNTAYAQVIKTDSFPIFDTMLDLWQITRNFAFAIVAMFMTITGIMIMMRKQINPKTAVTVQNALPRLVIALALIAFSYAISALFIALIIPLTSVALEPVRIAKEEAMTNGPIVTFLFMLLGSSGGLGVTFVTLLLYIVAFLVLLAVFAMAIFKLITSYVEALALVVIAPLQFAWGAIPGNEKSIIDWFKAMSVAILSIPAVTAGLSFGLYFAWSSVAAADSAAAEANIVGPLASGWFEAGVSGWTTLLTPIMVIGIFMFSAKLPSKLKESILDKRS